MYKTPKVDLNYLVLTLVKCIKSLWKIDRNIIDMTKITHQKCLIMKTLLTILSSSKI